ncbi:MAG: hypothetical protein JRN06_03210 [Nitrososphaerota archaeon]|nr:hypothetical protein [Nitrososphaerota archaeon]MDG7023133.1 hypothetical protein [Nitrososphaerota archaeon]
MLRETLETAYAKTIGALKDEVVGVGSSVTKREGFVQAAYLTVMVAVMAGFVGALIFPVSNQSYIPYPSGTAETIPEAFVDSFVIAVGGAGIYITYLSGRQTTSSRTVDMYLALALLLLVVSVFAGIDMAILKGFG